MATEYRVELPQFSGPLDLLLHLVKRNEVDVRDLPIAPIAEQFRSYIEVLQVIDMELAGDFLVLAATLLEIKSKLLLPRDAAEETEEPTEDPRQDLVKQLLEYKKYKEAALHLESRATEHQRRLPRAPVERIAPTDRAPNVQPVELWDLVSAFGRLMSETAALEPQQIIEDETPQSAYQDQIRERLAGPEPVNFRTLFTPPFYRVRLVGLFLAVLDLIKRGEIILGELDADGEIWLVGSPNRSPSAGKGSE